MKVFTFNQAVEALFESHDGIGSIMQPSRSMSTMNPRNGVWTLRTVNGYLVSVASTGRVWRFTERSAV